MKTWCLDRGYAALCLCDGNSLGEYDHRFSFWNVPGQLSASCSMRWSLAGELSQGRRHALQVLSLEPEMRQEGQDGRGGDHQQERSVVYLLVCRN